MKNLRISEILSDIDTIAPFALAEEWDHCGLRLGARDAEVSAIAVSLEPSVEAVNEAGRRGCGLLVTHHPLFFRSVENLVTDTPDACAAEAAFRQGVNIISCHTSLDSAHGGVNEVLSELAGLENVKPLEEPSLSVGFGMGAVGDIPLLSAEKFCSSAASSWSLSGWEYYGHGGSFSRVALCGGSGGDLWRKALDAGASLYITADMGYHARLEALSAGLDLMICDHGEMEHAALPSFAGALAGVTGLPVTVIDLKSAGVLPALRFSLMGDRTL